MNYAGSTYGGDGGFVPAAPGAPSSGTLASHDDEPVIPSPSRGHPALGSAWHPGGPGFLRGGDPSWMSFGEPRGPVFPPAQHPWTGMMRNDERLRGEGGMYGYGQSPYGAPMNVGGPSPYMNPGGMMADPYFAHHMGMGVPMGVPHTTPVGMGMPMGIQMMPGFNTPGMYPQHMMGAGHPWAPTPAPAEMGLPRNFHEPEVGNAMLGGRRMGKNFDAAVFVDKWEPGKHYGPVLSSRMISILKPKFEVNPLLLSSTVRGDGDYIEWNMLFPESSAHLSSEPRHQSWRKGRDSPAVIPRTDEIVIISPYFRWIHTAKSHRPGRALSCSELLHETFKFLHTYAQSEEYNVLQKSDPARHREVYKNWQRNRSREHRDVPGGALPDGMLKIDFMLMQTMFDGFIIEDNLGKEKLGLGKNKGSWRELGGQGGNGKCVLVLLSLSRGFSAGGGSAGASPGVRITEVGPSASTTPSGLPVPL